jgi:hypothetical protein
MQVDSEQVSFMSEPYQILELRADSPEVIEQLGSKRKFWFRIQGDDQPWLFKFTRENTGEDWSEKIASELAKLLGVPAATVDLARFMGKRGCASRSFVHTKKGFALIHGSEVLAGRVLGYEKSKQWGQSDHCIKNILTAVEKSFPTQRQRISQLRTLAGFMVLDAIICNTDRHHDNWGLLSGPSSRGKRVHEIAPSFDHASSLGRELRDSKRMEILARNDMERYALRGRGGIFWEDTDLKGENPLLLVTKAVESFPKYFHPWILKLNELQDEDIAGIVGSVPVEWMSAAAKEFCIRLMIVTIKKLKEVCI